MKIHEYQGKEILKRYGVAVPRGMACFSVDEAIAAADKLGGPVWVVKAQVHAGGAARRVGRKAVLDPRVEDADVDQWGVHVSSCEREPHRASGGRPSSGPGR